METKLFFICQREYEMHAFCKWKLSYLQWRAEISLISNDGRVKVAGARFKLKQLALVKHYSGKLQNRLNFKKEIFDKI